MYMNMYMYAFRSSRGLCPGRGELRVRYMYMFIIIVHVHHVQHNTSRLLPLGQCSEFSSFTVWLNVHLLYNIHVH